MALPTIASFWYGSDLSWVEIICIKSYLDQGHRFVLYTLHPVAGVPEGAEVRSAKDILWPAPFEVADYDRHRVAVFSDLFRLELMHKTPFIWVDLDAYCVAPFDFDTPYVVGVSGEGRVLTGVLRLPDTSEALRLMRDFVTSPNPSQPWRGPRLQRINARRVRNGESWGIQDLPWGCSGPKALSYFMKQTGEEQHALPAHVLYPLPVKQLWQLHSAQIPTERIEREGVCSVHIYGHQRKHLAQNHRGLPYPRSYLSRLCERHAVDPKMYPIPQFVWPQKVEQN